MNRRTDLESYGLDSPDVPFILGFEEFDHVHGHGYVSPVFYMDAPDGPLVFHGKVELILVLVCGLLLEPMDAVLL